MTLKDLLNTIKKNNLKIDFDLIQLAYEFAEKAHFGQKRASGEDYIQHSLETANLLAKFKVDETTIIAGLFHDIPEETKISLEEIKKEFGEEIANLVEDITKLGKIKYRGIERYVENLRKMFVAIAKDTRVIFIKFADRMHNLKTLSALPKEKQKRIALESLEIYAPIAHRLGMNELRGQLEDLAFPYVYPQEYKITKKIFQEKIKVRNPFVEKFKKELLKELVLAGFKNLEIHGRIKHLYSFYLKLNRPEINKNPDKIYDLVAIRIIVPEKIVDCYSILGLIHSKWKPLPQRIKDYIAMPKSNGYQSLHTTVFGSDDKIIEIQIRTEKMHRETEYGIAANWVYAEKGKPKQGAQIDKKRMIWLNHLLEWQKESESEQPEEFLKKLKMNFFKDRIFIFTPKGDVIDLPEQATPIDFAYHVHTDIGHSCTGALINNHLSALDTLLKSGDVVKIITSKSRKKPSLDWLKFTKTHQARSKIKSALKI
ncbi:bifunctional (p)ppGpp synthetase/guanosine-3',5'-bis(diphosphate) 3'-pyrophosphohydrolase [Candidatus Kuenenbacteria bacterium]|nr:bifunctional (p)ppGpp synthetase/guanosine-3',5'-bis(diphosphate) 3'-pyrophosphohydrolase [Candidatus Kuenenbacteria bacterium]